jgi:WW domain-binding protein 4
VSYTGIFCLTLSNNDFIFVFCSSEEVDLELPSTENEYVATSEADIVKTKVVFKEKTVTSLGVAADGVAPVFKKRRIENGKSRNLRQRGDDQ